MPTKVKQKLDTVTVNVVHDCRSCGSPLVPILDLGEQRLAGWDDSPDSDKTIAPLNLLICSDSSCSLVQLGYTVNPDLLFREYYYMSGINQTMKDALADITKRAVRLCPLNPHDVVLDIGCNDGTLLRSYNSQSLVKVGFDPAINLVEKSKDAGDVIINDYFSAGQFNYRKAKIITAIAMFYDLDKPHSFLSDVAQCLDNDGVFIIQMSYLPLMLFQCAFDNICHEHLTYYSLQSLSFLLEPHDLRIFDAEINDINGGSIRVYISKGSRYESPMLKSLREWEGCIGLRTHFPYDTFRKRCEEIRDTLREKIAYLNGRGKKIFGYAASTKGNVLLQYCGFTKKDIQAIADRNPKKWHKYCAGSGIPVISEQQARSERPNYFLVLAWAFMEEFMKRERDWHDRGGRFIVPLPKVTVI